MDYKVYDIKSLSESILNLSPNGDFNYSLFSPSFVWGANNPFSTYVVEKSEEGRIDMIMQSIYGVDLSYFSDLDIILYLNDIDNPLNILAGTEIIYIQANLLDNYRYRDLGDSVVNDDIKKALSVPNKTTRTDKNRQSFVDNNYSLPPVVSSDNTPPVKVTSNKIIVGGLK
jgi:hypothetical protein